jgi:hypothetical protein
LHWKENNNFIPSIPQNISYIKLYTIYFIDSMIGWTAGNYESILKTTDGGTSWNFQHNNWHLGVNVGYDYYFTDMRFTDSLHGWAVGGNGSGLYFYTTDGGKNWIGNDSGNIGFYNISLSFPDSLHGWIVSTRGGNIGKSEDGGKTWQFSIIDSDSINIAYQFYDVDFFDSLYGWVSGVQFVTVNSSPTSRGVILNTTDGGKSWSKYFLQDAQNLYSLSFPSKKVGFVTSDSGYIYKYSAPLRVPEEHLRNTPDMFTNYPNPFTGTTTIQATLSDEERTRVWLHVYNVLGEQVSDLTSQLRQNSTILFNASSLLTGAYYGVLTTPTRQLRRQMFIVK